MGGLLPSMRERGASRQTENRLARARAKDVAKRPASRRDAPTSKEGVGYREGWVQDALCPYEQRVLAQSIFTPISQAGQDQYPWRARCERGDGSA